ncbi:hypothetical protein LCGC14_1955440 [marine sediment metagenome]|uniref:Uncharacterized protein n=1 Tax=marine sediment metagenome TaxID=412755 RepID=A0A0F9G4L4_9ZZZZ
MPAFNSYTVYNEEGGLIAHGREATSTPETYFARLAVDIRRQAHVLLVLQEQGYVAMYMVTHPVAPVPTLGPIKALTPPGASESDI